MHMSYVWLLDKNNGKFGIDALRLVHGLAVLTKMILGILWQESRHQVTGTKPPHNVYHVRQRRREGAVAVQLINALRLKQALISYLRNLRDTANAYPSILHEALADKFERTQTPFIVHGRRPMGTALNWTLEAQTARDPLVASATSFCKRASILQRFLSSGLKIKEEALLRNVRERPRLLRHRERRRKERH